MNGKPDPSVIADAVAEAHRNEQVNAARAAMPASEYLDSLDLEHITGTPASTWRYWAHMFGSTVIQVRSQTGVEAFERAFVARSPGDGDGMSPPERESRHGGGDNAA